MKKKVLSIFLVLVMILCFVPKPVSAAGMQSGTTALTVNSTKVGFAGYEWWVIGYNGTGVYSTANDTNHATLLAKGASFGNSEFRVSNSSNEYADSTLQLNIEKIANSFPTKEQKAISVRTLTAEDDIKGSSISNQKLWALSRKEVQQINNNAISPIGFSWWLRTPHESDNNNASAVGGNQNKSMSEESWPVKSSLVIRPALSLNLTSILFTSEANDKNGKGIATVDGGFIEVSSPGSDATIKFTMKDSSQSLTLTANAEQTIQSSETLVFDYISGTTGNNQYISCVLMDNTGTVKYYDKLKDSSAASSGTISISLNGVADGTYTLKVFSEEANDALYTDFCSEPISMTVAVNKGVGTVSEFGGSIVVIPQLKIDSNNNWCVSYDNGKSWTSLGVKATGAAGTNGSNGITPHIGSDGYWYVGDTKTEVKAQGEKGDTGLTGAKGDTGATGQNGKDGVNGKDGIDGKDGINGKDGTNGKDGVDGKNGTDGTDGTDGIDGKDGVNGVDGKDGIGIKKTEINTDGELVITYTDGTVSNLGVVVGENGKDGLTPFIGDNGNWWIGDTDTGVKAVADNNTTNIVVGGVAGISLLSNIGLIIYILKKKKV